MIPIISTERERLIQFLTERQMSYRDLARLMKWSPTFVFGFLGGAWSLTDSFRLVFAQTFGWDTARSVLNMPEPQPQEETV